MMTLTVGRRALVVALTVCLAVLLVVASIGVAAAKKPDRPPGQGNKELTTVQLQDIYPGTTSPTGAYRWLDVADQAYAGTYQSSYDYIQASVEVRYKENGKKLQGTLIAANLKPNFTYQVKLMGSPEDDPDANERIGLAGRWWQEEWNGSEWANGRNLNSKGDGSSPNPNDVTYFARRDIPYVPEGTADPSSTGKRYRYVGYMPFDYFTTDGTGSATLDFTVDSSYHVLWETLQRGRTSSDGPVKTSSFDPDTSSPAYDVNYAPATVGVFGEWERLPVGGTYLAPGSYLCQLMLTEESFHGSGGALAGNWAGAMGAQIDFAIVAKPGKSRR